MTAAEEGRRGPWSGQYLAGHWPAQGPTIYENFSVINSNNGLRKSAQIKRPVR